MSVIPFTNKDEDLNKATKDAGEWLKSFPVFRKVPPVPLMLGIYEVLLSYPHMVSPAGIKNFLKEFCTSKTYHIAVAAPGSMRHNLDGNPVSQVSDTDRFYAQDQIDPKPQKKFWE